jgi:hypothetical protein
MAAALAPDVDASTTENRCPFLPALVEIDDHAPFELHSMQLKGSYAVASQVLTHGPIQEPFGPKSELLIQVAFPNEVALCVG